jgi:hypothetical protein
MFAAVRGDMEGNAEEALEDLREGIAIAEEIGDLPLLVEGHLRRGFILYNMGELRRAEAEFVRCSKLAEELGSTRDEARATFALALIKYWRGDEPEANRLSEQARAWLQRTGETFFQIQNLIALGQYALARDEPTVAEQRFREALGIALDEDSFLVAEIYRLLTETLIRLDRLSDASDLVEFAARGTGVDHPYVNAAIAMAEAGLLNAIGDLAAAASRYEEAVGILDELGLPLELSQARVAYARILRDMGESAAAREQLDIARVACERMGATGLLVDVDQQLALIATAAG